MAKKTIRLTEGELQQIIIESVKKLIKENGYEMPNGGFDSSAYEYDNAFADSDDIDQFDKAMAIRKKENELKGNNAMHYHPQAEPDKKLIRGFDKNRPIGSIDSFRYKQGFINNPEEDRKISKQLHGF